jgi:hypothetical protein
MHAMKNILPINRGCACLMLLAVLTGCAGTRPGAPGLASKPNMLFSDSRVFSYQNRLQSQVEPGSALSGGAQPTGGNCCK